MTSISVGTATFTNEDTASNSYVVTKPSGMATGDYVYLVAGNIAAITMTPPAGFTQVQLMASGTNIRLGVWRRKIDGSEGSTFTVSLASTSKGFIAAVPGSAIDATTPEDASADGTTSSGSATTSPSVTVGIANARTLYFTMSRHAFGNKTLSHSDGSDSVLGSHGSTSVSGFDYSYLVAYSNRDLGTGAAGRVETISATTESEWAWVAISLKPGTPVPPKARVYQLGVSAPGATAPAKARVYKIGISAPSTGGGARARVYMLSLSAPSRSNAGKSGFYYCDGVNIIACQVYSCVAGEV